MNKNRTINLSMNRLSFCRGPLLGKKSSSSSSESVPSEDPPSPPTQEHYLNRTEEEEEISPWFTLKCRKHCKVLLCACVTAFVVMAVIVVSVYFHAKPPSPVSTAASGRRFSVPGSGGGGSGFQTGSGIGRDWSSDFDHVGSDGNGNEEGVASTSSMDDVVTPIAPMTENSTPGLATSSTLPLDLMVITNKWTPTPPPLPPPSATPPPPHWTIRGEVH